MLNTEIELEGQIDDGASNKQQKHQQEQPLNNAQKPNDPLNLGMFKSLSNLKTTLTSIEGPQEWIIKRKNSLKAWTEFINVSKFKKPSSLSQCASRLIKNIDYFQSNYLFVFIGLAIYCVITSPYLLITLFTFVGACYIIYLKYTNANGKLKIFGRDLNLAQVYSLAFIVSIPLFIFAGASSALFWIIGASIFCICLHACFYSRDEEDPFNTINNTQSV